MKQYDCYIFSNVEVAALCGKPVEFEKGFMTNKAKNPDWLNILERHIGKPIVSIRNTDRESWKEILVLCANGHLTDDGTPVLCGTLDYLKVVLADIFMEADNDEYEVFDCFQFEIKNGTYKELCDYVHEVW